MDRTITVHFVFALVSGDERRVFVQYDRAAQYAHLGFGLLPNDDGIHELGRLTLELNPTRKPRLWRTVREFPYLEMRWEAPTLDPYNARFVTQLLSDDKLLYNFVELLRCLAKIAYNHGPSYRDGASWRQTRSDRFMVLPEGFSGPGSVSSHQIHLTRTGGRIELRDPQARLILEDFLLQEQPHTDHLWSLLCNHHTATAGVMRELIRNAPHWPTIMASQQQPQL